MQIPKPVKKMWIVPMVGYQHSDTEVYVIMDIDIWTNRAQTMEDLKKEFLDNYGSNKAPLGYYFHMSYFINEEGNYNDDRINFWIEFFQWIVTHDKVLFATEDRAIAWTKSPKKTFVETKAMLEFKCDFSIYNADNSCNDGKTKKICDNPKPLDARPQYTICGSSCPNLLPEINTLWKYQNGAARKYVNSQTYFDTPYNGVTANLNYPKFTGTVRLEPFSGTSTPEVNQWGINGQACAVIIVENQSETWGANGFILTVDWCAANVKVQYAYLPRGNKVDLTSGKYKGFKATGDIKDAYMRVSGYYFGEFCLTVNTDGRNNFKWGNIKAGIDFYRVPLFCSLSSTNSNNKCTSFCGNLVCDSNKGENSINCPIDCSKTDICP